MARCVLCSFAATRGYLCDAHAKTLAIASLTPEQVVAQPDQPVATLIDPFGNALPIDAATTIGRDLEDHGVVLLHSSVSQRHATITLVDGRWTLRDEGSRNGTFVDGKKTTEAILTEGARVQIGEVPMYFVARVLQVQPKPEGPGRTTPTRRDQLIFSAKLALPAGARIELSQRVEGGVLRVGDASVELGKLEFRLLQVLTEARQTAADPEFAFMSWQQLAAKLEFKSHEADSENVRELVRRVRRKLNSAGVEELLESKHGVGYRVGADPVDG
jgi:pSer/pThr/pTyr-binding forkhead associated (FHA) protein